MSNPQTPPPGWFADPAGSPHNRWWDGTQWTDTLQQPYQSSAVAARAPEGTNPSTVQIWLIVGFFAAQTIAAFAWLATFDFAGYMKSSLSASTDPTSSLATLGYIFTPSYGALIAFAFVAYVGTVVLAYFDAKTLIFRGVERPFPWALAFIPSYGSLVYVIGRSVVVRRRTGTGYAPLWAFIIIFAVTIIGTFVWVIAASAGVMGDIAQYAG